MPLYEYACEECGRQSEQLVNAGSQPNCPECGSPRLSKLLSIVASPGRGNGVAGDRPEFAAGPVRGELRVFSAGVGRFQLWRSCRSCGRVIGWATPSLAAFESTRRFGGQCPDPYAQKLTLVLAGAYTEIGLQPPISWRSNRFGHITEVRMAAPGA